MNELSTQARQLPETIEEKTAYVLFGPEALRAYRKNLTAVKQKYGISSEQYKQIQLEAQETAENVLMYSVDVGNYMKNIPTAKGTRSDLQTSSHQGVEVKTKAEAIQEMGFTRKQAETFQTMANHPETVQKAIEDARKEDRIVTRQDVFNHIATEHEDRKQKEARELREAKKRHEDYKEQKTDGVVDFQSAKQDSEDKRKIFEALQEEIRKLDQHIRHFACDLENGKFQENLSGATKNERREIYGKLRNMNSTIINMQREVMEDEE